MKHLKNSFLTSIVILALFTNLVNGQIGGTLGASNYLKETTPGASRKLGELMSYDGARVAANAGQSEIVIFAVTGNGWIQEDTIDLGEVRFSDLSISGDLLAVGASLDGELAANAGSVFIFFTAFNPAFCYQFACSWERRVPARQG